MTARPSDLTVTELLDGYRRATFSPVEVVTDVLSRIAETEPDVKAWSHIDDAGALRAARELETRGKDRQSLPALYGVPIGAKDIIDARGIPTKAGFEPFSNRIPHEDSAAIRPLREAGAIVLGKTLTVQFAWGQDVPATRNPWDLARTPGGSSTGSAAAVAARNVPLALGTQTTGSLLRPAAYCGVVALKPSFGRISNAGVLPTSWSSDHIGAMVRSVADAALWLQCYAGGEQADGVARGQDLAAAARERTAPPRLGVVRELVDRSEPTVREGFASALSRFRQQGADIREVRLPVLLEQLLASHWLILASEGAAIHAELHSRQADHYMPRTRTNIEVALLLPAAVYGQALRLRRRFRPLMERLFEGVDVLIAPAAPQNAPIPNASGAHPLGDPNFQAVWTSFGFPNLSLPTGLDAEQLPSAVQLIARNFEERGLLSASAWCERIVGPLGPPLSIASKHQVRL